METLGRILYVCCYNSSFMCSAHSALLEAIKAQPQRLAINEFRDAADSQKHTMCDEHKFALTWQTLPKFGDQWRDLNGVRVGGSSSDSVSGSPDDYYLQLCSFSAALLKLNKPANRVLYHLCGYFMPVVTCWNREVANHCSGDQIEYLSNNLEIWM